MPTAVVAARRRAAASRLTCRHRTLLSLSRSLLPRPDLPRPTMRNRKVKSLMKMLLVVLLYYNSFSIDNTWHVYQQR